MNDPYVPHDSVKPGLRSNRLEWRVLRHLRKLDGTLMMRALEGGERRFRGAERIVNERDPERGT